MLNLIIEPLRSILGLAEREVVEHTPLEETEGDILVAVEAIHQAAVSIEHHVEVIEGLATSVGPLTESVNQLTATMADLVVLLAPLGSAEHEIHRVGSFFGRHRRDAEAKP